MVKKTESKKVASSTMSPSNIKASPEKLESALETVKVKGMKMVKAWGYLNSKQSTTYQLVGGKGNRMIEVAAFLAILINCGAMKITAKGRVEKTPGKPFYRGLVNALYFNGTKGTIFRAAHIDRFDETGLTSKGVVDFQARLNDESLGWNTDYKLVRAFRDLMSGKLKTINIKDSHGKSHTFKRQAETSVMVKTA